MTSATSATTTTAETTSSETTDSDGDSGQFIMSPDGSCFASCGIVCDVWGQDCAEGDKCMAWANDGGNLWNSNRCTPIAPEPAGIGDPCVVEGNGVSGIDDCELGAMCWGVDPRTNEGTCVPMCTGSEANPICPDGLECQIASDGVLIVCLPSCDPLAPSCADDEVCAPLSDLSNEEVRFSCLPIPPFEPQPYGSECDGLQVCDDGLLCVPEEHVPDCGGFACCTQLGDSLQMPSCPDESQTCIPLFESPPDPSTCFCGVAP
jgi:hypothetical protein